MGKSRLLFFLFEVKLNKNLISLWVEVLEVVFFFYFMGVYEYFLKK